MATSFPQYTDYHGPVMSDLWDDEPESDTPPPAPPAEHPVKRAAGARLEVMRTFGQIGSIGLAFALAVGIGAAVGLWLDRLTGWSPVLFIVFFIAGFAAGVVNVSRITKSIK